MYADTHRQPHSIWKYGILHLFLIYPFLSVYRRNIFRRSNHKWEAARKCCKASLELASDNRHSESDLYSYLRSNRMLLILRIQALRDPAQRNRAYVKHSRDRACGRARLRRREASCTIGCNLTRASLQINTYDRFNYTPKRVVASTLEIKFLLKADRHTECVERNTRVITTACSAPISVHIAVSSA